MTQLELTTPLPFETVDHFSEVWSIERPGDQVSEARRQAEDFKRRLRSSGAVEAVRTFDLVQFPYPMKYGLKDAIRTLYPYFMMRHRMNLVQYRDAEGARRTLLINPTQYELGVEAPFFKNLAETYGEFLSQRVMSKRFNTALDAVRSVGLEPEDIDYVAFDHWHVQDLRPILGTTDGAFSPLFPNARCIVNRREVETLLNLHPLQKPWYVADAIRDADLSRLIIVEDDLILGDGVAIIATPGHTQGNQTFVLNTPAEGRRAEAIYTISENGVAPESYRPEMSTMPGVRAYARTTGQEVVLNGNTVERILEQYTSMLIEKTLADPSEENPNFLNTYPSSPFVPSMLTPGLKPTFRHSNLNVGVVREA